MKNGPTIPTYVLLERNREKGIELLYERYGKKLYSYGLKSWNLSEDQAWEMTYKTLYKTLEKFEEYEFSTEKKFGSFLFTIFCNDLRRHYRDTKKREEKLSFTTYNEQLFEESHGNLALGSERQVQEKIMKASVEEYRQEDLAVTNPLMDELEDCLEQLEDWERVLILLRVQNMPYTEIANYVSKPANQLKVYHQRARKKLDQLIETRTSSLKNQAS
jgi:RNA polymerase sigma-70 factor (ECF subfamily)